MSTAPSQQQPQPSAEAALMPEATLLDRVIDATALRIDGIADAYAAAANNQALGRLRRAAIIGAGILQLRSAITSDFMKKVVMPLMNSQLGFMTDRPSKKLPTPYNEQEVRDCLIAALLEGVMPFNNEFNIISGRMYVAKLGYRRKVTEIPGLTDLVLSPGIPRVDADRTCVRFAASWKYQGMDGQLLGTDGKPGRTFVVAVNDYMGPDAILGKAERKALKAIYEQVTGTEHTAPDGEVGETAAPVVSVPEGATRTEQVAAKLGANGPPTPEPSESEAQAKERARPESTMDTPAGPGEPSPEPGPFEPEQMALADDIAEIRERIGGVGDELNRNAMKAEVQAHKYLNDEWKQALLLELEERWRSVQTPYTAAKARRAKA